MVELDQNRRRFPGKLWNSARPVKLVQYEAHTQRVVCNGGAYVYQVIRLPLRFREPLQNLVTHPCTIGTFPPHTVDNAPVRSSPFGPSTFSFADGESLPL